MSEVKQDDASEATPRRPGRFTGYGLRERLNPIAFISRVAGKSDGDAQSIFPAEGHDETRQDAARHMLGMARVSRAYGAVPAKTLGYVWEAIGLGSKIPDMVAGRQDYREAWNSSLMDIRNNQIGADELAKVPGDDDALRDSVKARINSSGQYQPSPTVDANGRPVWRR